MLLSIETLRAALVCLGQQVAGGRAGRHLCVCSGVVWCCAALSHHVSGFVVVGMLQAGGLTFKGRLIHGPEKHNFPPVKTFAQK